jgi:lipoyl synthase
MEVKEPSERKKRPDWLRVKLPIGESYRKVREIVDNNKLHTICQSGNCPNMGECWGEGTATFMILGNICTRSCNFCAVATGRPTEYDTDEPQRVAEAIKTMGVKHAVITSVNRDELKDKGAEIWYQTVVQTKELSPKTTIETLIPDTKSDWDALYRMISAGQEVVSHNMETKDEVFEAMDHLAENGCDILTLGQYLQPTKMHHEVIEFIHPDMFALYREEGLKRGIKYVESGPLVRSSYHSERHVNV